MRIPRFIFGVALAVVAGCNEGATEPSDGRLAVTISGLPAAAEASVTVTGPDGFNVDVQASETLSDLRGGTYTVTASEVTTAQGRYAPTPAQQTVSVSSGVLANATAISYALGTARLSVSILGLPAGAQASVVVTGPGGFSRTVTAATALDLLAPGTYTITAADVSSGGRAYRPDPTAQSVTLAASTTSVPVAVGYGAGSGALDLSVGGLPAGTNADVRVTGPGAFERIVRSTQTLRYLEAGTYTIASAVVGADLTTYTPTASTQTSDVADNATSATSVTYQGAPLQLRLNLVVEGLTAPVFVDAPPGDSRIFVVERNGRIRIIQNGVLVSTPFLDITSRVNFIGERGMLGMAFDPGYATNGRFFVYYVDLGGGMALERFASTPGSNVAGASDGIVLSFAHGGSEHHGGMIAFGPDGMLYVGPGDGRCCGDPDNNAQRTFNLLGKLLRLDVRTLPYRVPPDNPFVDRFDARPEIWAFGLRNPWRFSFDTESNLLFIGDVGQDVREEVNVAPSTTPGINYGWRLMEGTACYNPGTNCNSGQVLRLPAHEYTHADGCSVTGGYVYRGPSIPELTGHYLYADYCRGWVRSVRVVGSTGSIADHRLWSGVSAPQVVSFGRDGQGDLYLVAGTRIWKLARG